MLHFYNRAGFARALTLDLDPKPHRVLAARIAALGEELIDWTELILMQPGDDEADIVRHIGLSPVVEPMEGARFGTSTFWPHWDWLAAHDGYWELHFTFGSTFCYIVLIPDVDGVPPELRRLCRNYVQT